MLKRFLTALAVALPLTTVSTTTHAFCGFYAGKADATLFNEASQVVVVRDGQRTVLSMLNDYKGPLNEFALVVPTPTTLQKGQVRIADKTTFERLDAYSSPRLAEYHDADPCQTSFTWGQDRYPRAVYAPATMMLREKTSTDRASALGVTVEAQYTLEEYDIVSLSATQSDGLETWLRENGYKIPKGASVALKPYIKQGMKFFVAKVNLKEQAKTGYTMLRPLQFAFESEKFMLPMRLGMLNAAPDKAQDLIVYLLTKEGRVESSNYRTVKLPSNVNLPHFIKPKFQDFYKAMFDNEAKKENQRVVFTEYFWDMAWCDPCAANPLSPLELRKAGVFWVGGNPDDTYRAMTSPAVNHKVIPPAAQIAPMPPSDGAQPVVLTRLHVRYTPTTFPEDLMFTQTKDRQNWQTRYVIQQPYASNEAQCSEKVGQMDCDKMCSERVKQVVNTPSPDTAVGIYRDKDPQGLLRDCRTACKTSQHNARLAAARYYRTDLPQRISKEKQTLAQLTGWNLARIDAMPGAQQWTEPKAGTIPPSQNKPWWETFFETSQERLRQLSLWLSWQALTTHAT